MRPAYRYLSILTFLALAGCDYPPTSDKPQSVSDLGIATPDHPVTNAALLAAAGPAQIPVPSPAVARATDAGAMDEVGPVEAKE